MTGSGFSFPREEHLKKRAEIQKILKKGRSVSCYGAKLFYKERTAESSGRRIAFTFVRKYGNAVARNRSRRLSREAYRHLRGRLKGGIDMVLMVFPESPLSQNTADARWAGVSDYEKRLHRLKVLFRRADLFVK